jgi:ADP-heptose:LPS heptosyltransferase
VLLWGPDEIHMARQIRDGLSSRAILAPPTDLDELTALLRRCRLLVANDTGPLHLAAALGTRCVGLYGPTTAERNGPYGGGHRSLQSPDGTMTSLAVDPVLRAVVELLDGPAPDQPASERAR